MRREDFFPRVWELVAEIPYGKVATYGQLADMLGYRSHALCPGGSALPPGNSRRRTLCAFLA